MSKKKAGEIPECYDEIVTKVRKGYVFNLPGSGVIPIDLAANHVAAQIGRNHFKYYFGESPSSGVADARVGIPSLLNHLMLKDDALFLKTQPEDFNLHTGIWMHYGALPDDFKVRNPYGKINYKASVYCYTYWDGRCENECIYTAVLFTVEMGGKQNTDWEMVIEFEEKGQKCKYTVSPEGTKRFKMDWVKI